MGTMTSAVSNLGYKVRGLFSIGGFPQNRLSKAKIGIAAAFIGLVGSDVAVISMYQAQRRAETEGEIVSCDPREMVSSLRADTKGYSVKDQLRPETRILLQNDGDVCLVRGDDLNSYIIEEAGELLTIPSGQKPGPGVRVKLPTD